MRPPIRRPDLSSIRRRLSGAARLGSNRAEDVTLIPADPRLVLTGTLDPELDAIRAALRPHRRRLWLRRIVRRAWIAAAIVAATELGLWMLARLIPIEAAPAIGVLLPVAGLLGLTVAAIHARPSLGETSIAVDREGQLGDRAASALALAAAVPAAAGPPTPDEEAELASEGESVPIDRESEERRFVRRQRHDALGALRILRSDLFRPRLSRRPAAVAAVAVLLLAPVVLIPNPQDAVIAQAREVREEAQATAQKLDELAKELEDKGTSTEDPRTRLAQELRELARKLRENPADLDTNLAKLGAVESAVRAQLDPANEQRAASLAALSRSLSRAASGDPNANVDGDPSKAADDLKDLGDKLDELSTDELKDLAKSLSEMQGAGSQAGGAVAQALRDAAQSLGQGDIASAQQALDRLGEALGHSSDAVQTNRDLANAANRLQDGRRDLADAGRPGGQQGGQQGGQGGQQGGQGGQQGGQGGQQGGQAGQPGGPGGSLSGAIGGGGSNAAYLGSGIGGNTTPRGPVNPNRPSVLGEDLSKVFAPFNRLGRPGDPSYIAGTGGDGQTSQGNQQGPGVDPGSYVPYSQVYADFYRYALTSLDRAYVPLSVKDFVRDYFSSLDPTQ